MKLGALAKLNARSFPPVLLQVLRNCPRHRMRKPRVNNTVLSAWPEALVVNSGGLKWWAELFLRSSFYCLYRRRPTQYTDPPPSPRGLMGHRPRGRAPPLSRTRAKETASELAI